MNEFREFVENLLPNDALKIKKVRNDVPFPQFGYEDDAGMDVSAAYDIIIPANSYKLVKTGLSFGIPKGYELQVRGRSGLANRGIICHFGTVDSGYTGELGVVLFNFNNKAFPVEKGTRIAQVVPNKLDRLDIEETNELEESLRGTNGFGSTGL